MVVSAVCCSVRVAEGDIFYIVADHGCVRRREVVAYRVHWHECVCTCYDVYEHGLSSTVWSDDGYMFITEEFEINRISHSPRGHSAYSVMNTDDLLHLEFFSRKVVLCRYAELYI